MARGAPLCAFACTTPFLLPTGRLTCLHVAAAPCSLISVLQPAQNKDLMASLMVISAHCLHDHALEPMTVHWKAIFDLQDKRMTAFALDQIPRTLSKSQACDVLSSMANIAGYRAVVEASHTFGRMFAPQARRLAATRSFFNLHWISSSTLDIL